jgi:adenylate cyclase
LFADVVHSMEIAAAVGAERLREIMADLVDGSSVIVQRYGGTVDKFTADGIMAIFGAPVALEDHGAHACRASAGLTLDRYGHLYGSDVEAVGVAINDLLTRNCGQNVGTAWASGHSSPKLRAVK